MWIYQFHSWKSALLPVHICFQDSVISDSDFSLKILTMGSAESKTRELSRAAHVDIYIWFLCTSSHRRAAAPCWLTTLCKGDQSGWLQAESEEDEGCVMSKETWRTAKTETNFEKESYRPHVCVPQMSLITVLYVSYMFVITCTQTLDMFFYCLKYWFRDRI